MAKKEGVRRIVIIDKLIVLIGIKSCRLILTAITAGASRVATDQLCMLAVAITPAGLMELVR
jgi:hypothetical protein